MTHLLWLMVKFCCDEFAKGGKIGKEFCGGIRNFVDEFCGGGIRILGRGREG